MGGFAGGGASSGNVGAAGRKSSGSYGTARDARRAGGRNEGRTAAKKVGNFIKGGGTIGAVARGISKLSKKSKQNVMDYEGQAAGVTPQRNPISGNDGGGEGNNQGILIANSATPTQEVSRTQQQAVASAPKGPTAVELNIDEDQQRLKVNRRGRRSTILGGFLEDEPETFKKVLLG